MLPGEIQALPDLDKAGYQNMLDWVASGARHGTLAGKVLNEAAVRHEMTPWGEGRDYDAAGNMVSLYRDARPGEVSPYGDSLDAGGPLAGPQKDENIGKRSAIGNDGTAGFDAQYARRGVFDVGR